MYPEIARIGQANPELEVRFNNDSREINVKVMGPVQAEILINLVKERTGLEVSLGRGHIVYKETIDDTVMGSGHFEPLRHYAEVHLRLEPGARGSGMVLILNAVRKFWPVTGSGLFSLILQNAGTKVSLQGLP